MTPQSSEAWEITRKLHALRDVALMTEIERIIEEALTRKYQEGREAINEELISFWRLKAEEANKNGWNEAVEACAKVAFEWSIINRNENPIADKMKELRKP